MTDLKTFWSLIPPSHRYTWMRLPVFAFCSSLFEALTAGLVFLLVRLMENPVGFFQKNAWFPFADLFQTWTPAGLILFFSGMTMGCYALRSGLFLGEVYLQSKQTHNEAARLAENLVKAYIEAPYAFYLQRNSSEILHKVFENIRTSFVHVATSSVGIISEAFLILALLGVLLYVTPGMTLGLIGAFVILIGGALRLAQRFINRWGQTIHEASQNSYRELQQLVHGFKEIHVSGREIVFLNRFTSYESTYNTLRIFVVTMIQLPRTVIEIGFSLFAFGLMAILLTYNWSSEHIVALLGVYTYAVFRVMPSLNRLSNYINTIRFHGPAIKSIRATWEDLAQARRSQPFEERLSHPWSFQDAIVLQDVSYTYPGLPPPLPRRSFPHHSSWGLYRDCWGNRCGEKHIGGYHSRAFEAEERVCACGWPGHPFSIAVLAGEKLVMSLNPFTSLMIPLRQTFTLGIRNAITSVLKTLFAWRSSAHLSKNYPMGQKRLLENVVFAFQGERQRIAIARALYQEPEILIFDEATAALDNETERNLTETIFRLKTSKTMIMIAHRLSTVETCDRLVLLKEGKVLCVDTYQDLLAHQADFQRLSGAA